MEVGSIMDGGVYGFGGYCLNFIEGIYMVWWLGVFFCLFLSFVIYFLDDIYFCFFCIKWDL